MAPPNDNSPRAFLAYLAADDTKSSPAGVLDWGSWVEAVKICSAAIQSKTSFAIQIDFKLKPFGVFRLCAARSAATRDDGAKGTLPIPNTWAKQVANWLQILGEWKQLLRNVEIVRRPESNEASQSTVRDFLEYGCRQCPEKKRVLFFFGHSFGPMGIFHDTDPESGSTNVLRINELAEAIGAEKPIDLLIFRDCFMANLEMIYELRGVASFVLASQAGIPIQGAWPWGDLMTAMAHDNLEAAAEACTKRMGEYFSHPESRKTDEGTFEYVPLSLLCVDAADAVGEHFIALVKAIDAARNKKDPITSTLADAFNKARTGGPDIYKDPGDRALIDVQQLCAGLKGVRDGGIGDEASHVISLLDGIVRCISSERQGFGGLSLYYKTTEIDDPSDIGGDPAGKDDGYYRALAFCNHTKWWLLAQTPL